MDTPETATVEVTQTDAVHFLESAFRNIELPPLSPRDVDDITDGLRRFARHRTRATRQDGLREALAPFAAVCAAFDYWVPEVMPQMCYPVAGTELANAMIDCPTAIGTLTEGDFRRAARALAALSDSSTREESGADTNAGDALSEAREDMLKTARQLRETANGDCSAIEQAIRWEHRAAALSASPEGEGK